MIELSDEEFHTFAWSEYGNRVVAITSGSGKLWSKLKQTTVAGLKQTTVTGSEQKLLDLKLLRWKSIRTKPNKNGYSYTGKVLKCSKRGRKVLHKDLLRLILVLARMEVHTYNDEFFKLVARLPREQLPALLVHEKPEIRLVAMARMAKV